MGCSVYVEGSEDAHTTVPCEWCEEGWAHSPRCSGTREVLPYPEMPISYSSLGRMLEVLSVLAPSVKSQLEDLQENSGCTFEPEDLPVVGRSLAAQIVLHGPLPSEIPSLGIPPNVWMGMLLRSFQEVVQYAQARNAKIYWG